MLFNYDVSDKIIHFMCLLYMLIYQRKLTVGLTTGLSDSNEPYSRWETSISFLNENKTDR